MEAIEDSDLLGIKHEDLQHLYTIDIEFKIEHEKYYASAEFRVLMGRLSKAEIKYEYFLKTYKHLSIRIPLKYVPSFLGVNMETLSRVRGKIRNISEK